MPGCIVSATMASFRSVEKRRRRATPVMTSTFENVSDIGVCLGLYLGPPAKAGVRSKQGAVQGRWMNGSRPAPGPTTLRPLRILRVLCVEALFFFQRRAVARALDQASGSSRKL